MEEKTFTFVASGLSFNLKTFETENKTFLTQRNDISFKSKAEFIKAIDQCIETFYRGMMERLEEGIPKLHVEYKGETVGLHFIDILNLNAYSKNDHVRKCRELIIELVREYEKHRQQLEENGANK